MSNKKLTYFTTIKFLSKYINRHKRSFILFYFGWLINALLKLYIPITFAIMIDEIVYYQNVDLFIKTSSLFAVMLFFSCLLYYFSEMQHSHLSTEYTCDIKQDVFDSLLNADADYLSNSNSGDIVNTIQNYIGDCVHFVVRNIIHVINRSFILIAFVVYVFILGWKIGLLMLLIVPFSVYISVKFGRVVKKVSMHQKEEVKNYSGWLFEMIAGIKVIRLLVARETTEKLFHEQQEEIFDANIKYSFLAKHAESAVQLVNLLVRLSIYGLAALMAYQNNMSIGMLLLILTYFSRMTAEVKELSGMYVEAQSRIAKIQHIYDLINASGEDKWCGKKALVVSKGEIQFKNIYFGYRKGVPVLNKLTLQIPGSNKVAICGKSGSGKSTLAYMLVGFYKPEKGYIKIDGQNLKDCTLSSIRQQIGIVQQDVLLLDGSIRENLLLGKNNASEKEVIDACQKAGIYEFIHSLPDGLNTVIGVNGIQLSGGQKQRIGIARIYLKNPRIIVFDEATSSLDLETEEKIQAEWREVLSGRTAIIIAHRYSAIKFCNDVAVLEDGAISVSGSPEVLAQTSRSFRELFALSEAIYD